MPRMRLRACAIAYAGSLAPAVAVGFFEEGNGMLFLLTGDVQIGKTRWLSRLVEDLAECGVQSAGVLAPGVWRERGAEEPDGAGGAAGAGRFEKLGIDNVLLPDGECVPFARRRDLALAEGSYDVASQSAAAQMAWEISDAAIARVNAHFDDLLRANTGANVSRETLARQSGLGAVASSLSVSCEDVSRETSSEQGERDGGVKKGKFVKSAKGERISEERTFADGRPDSCHPYYRAFLVVDELGQLELLRGGGLTSAMALLDRGATPQFPHALAVVRTWLLDCAVARFAEPWGAAKSISPSDDARAQIFSCFSKE